MKERNFDPWGFFVSETYEFIHTHLFDMLNKIYMISYSGTADSFIKI